MPRFRRGVDGAANTDTTTTTTNTIPADPNKIIKTPYKTYESM